MECMVVVSFMQILKGTENNSVFIPNSLTYHHSQLLYFLEDNALSRAAMNAFTSSTASSSSSQLCAGMTGNTYMYVVDNVPVL